MKQKEGGFTLVELLVSILVLSIVALAAFELMTALLNSTIVSKRQAIAYTLASNQMEYLKDLPYDRLAVAGGSIPAAITIPSTSTSVVNGYRYTVKTSIVYSDDAYDGCGSYPTQALKQQYCKNYPPPSGAPANDTNPADNKMASVSVTDMNGRTLASLDTIISARVAETASNTGALFVKIVDESGAPISGANVNIVNTSINPAINVNDNTDSNGMSIFYGLPPDGTNYDYNVTGSLGGYSTLTTIVPSGSLVPTYSNANLIAQNSVLVTLKLLSMGPDSLVVEATNTSGNALPNARIYIKGGYKRYTNANDTSYYYDNMRGGDTRPTTDAGGLTAIANLVPGDYIFCGDTGSTSCSVSGTTYYLAAALPYGGSNPLYPITVPTYSASNPPTDTFAYDSKNYYQKVRLILTTDSGFPRVFSMNPNSANLSSDPMSAISFSMTGANLPCSSNPASCGTQVQLRQGSDTYVASCTGTSGNQINCTVNLALAEAGHMSMTVTANGKTLNLPDVPYGGFNVLP